MPVSKTSRTTGGRGRLYESVLDTIGDTPSHPRQQAGPAGVRLYVKAEFFNPAASVKDRLAVSIIEEAERRGELKPGQTVVEATSGNTGIGLAMVCAAKGYPLVVTMADSFSIERRKLMRFLGAKVVLTPRAAKGFGMYLKAKELAETQRLVPGAPVRDRRQREDPREHDRPRDPRRLRRRPARLLGHRLRHRRHGRRRRPGAAQGAPGHEDHPERARERRARDERHPAGARARTTVPRPATRRGSRIRSRAGRPTSSRTSCRRRSTSATTTS